MTLTTFIIIYAANCLFKGGLRKSKFESTGSSFSEPVSNSSSTSLPSNQKKMKVTVSPVASSSSTKAKSSLTEVKKDPDTRICQPIIKLSEWNKGLLEGSISKEEREKALDSDIKN